MSRGRLVSVGVTALLLAAGCSSGPKVRPRQRPRPDADPAPAPAAQPERSPADLPNAWELSNKAEEAMEAGDYLAALKDLDYAGQLEGGNPRVMHLQGVCYARLGKAREARDAFAMAFATSRDYADPQFLAEGAKAYLAAGDARNAIKFVNRAEEPDGELLVVSARVKLRLGDNAGALAAAKAALAADPVPAEAEAINREVADRIRALKTHYLPAADPERLGEGALALDGKLRLQLPRGFAATGSAARPRARLRGQEVSLRLAPVEGLERDLGKARRAWGERAMNAGATVQASKPVKVAGAPGFFLHVVEPGPESGMFDAFAIVRYRWILWTQGGPAEVQVEAEVEPSATDLPDEVRRDVLAAVATLEQEG